MSVRMDVEIKIPIYEIDGKESRHMKKFLAGTVFGIVIICAVTYYNPFFPMILFCGEGLGRAWGANRCL